MDCDVEKRCVECYGCQMVIKNVLFLLLKLILLFNKLWEEVVVDLMGLLFFGEYLLVFVDYYSWWIEVDVI